MTDLAEQTSERGQRAAPRTASLPLYQLSYSLEHTGAPELVSERINETLFQADQVAMTSFSG